MAIEVSKYVSYNEVIRSATALRKNIENIPTEIQLDRIIILAKEVFDPLREWCAGRVKINSIFRSKKLNTSIGGAKSSQHLANKGAAMDIDDVYSHKTNLEMFYYIKDNLEFDQIIAEFPVDGQPKWIHVSYNEGANRSNALIAIKEQGRTKYVRYEGNEGLLG